MNTTKITRDFLVEIDRKLAATRALLGVTQDYRSREMKTIDKEYKEKVRSVKQGDVLRCTNYHGEHHYYMLAYHHTGYSNDWCAYGPRMTQKDFYCAVDLKDGDLFLDAQFEESRVADPSILKIVEVLTKWYKTVERVPYYGTVGQPKEDEA